MSGILKFPFNPARDNYTGCLSAPLELIMYGDFQCGHSGEVYTTIRLLQQFMGEQLRFVFRHFPLPAVHPLSLDAAMASEAAAAQGRFWDMYRLIFDNQKYLIKCSFSRLAESLDLDMAVFESSRGHKELVDKVINDFESGVKSGVDCTPTIFINSEKYNGFQDYDSLRKICKCAILINKQGILLKDAGKL